MTKRHRVPGAVALIAVLAFVTACGSNAPAGTASSANGTSATNSRGSGGHTGATSTSTHTQALTKREKAVGPDARGGSGA